MTKVLLLVAVLLMLSGCGEQASGPGLPVDNSVRKTEVICFEGVKYIKVSAITKDTYSLCPKYGKDGNVELCH